MDTPAQPVPLKSGLLSSEFHLDTVVAIGGLVLAGLTMFGGAWLSSGVDAPPWLKGVVAVAGIGSAIATSFGYRKSRTQLKLEQLKATVTPMLPQLLTLVNQVVDVVKDIKAGGLTAPADDPAATPALQTPSPAGGATSMPLQLATVAVKAVLPDSPIATAIAGAAEQVAEKAGAAAAAKVTDAQKAADVFNSTAVK